MMKLENKMSIFNKGFKATLFLVLFIVVMWQYAVEIYIKFNNVSTTFVSMTVDADSFTMPPMTICMDNGLKPSVLDKYGMTDIWEFVFEPLERLDNQTSSVWDAFVEASYLNGRDISIGLLGPHFSPHFHTLTQGNNYIVSESGQVIYVELIEYHTMISGTCYQVKSNITMHPPNWVRLDVAFNDSMDSDDIPQVIQV